jgi:AbrB family looped-hinge helix DNA binding protein
MAALTVKLSSNGQLLIPKELRERLHWEAGIELTLVPTGRGVLLQPSIKKAQHNLADLRGMLKYDGPPVSLEALCKPVDLGEANRDEDTP